MAKTPPHSKRAEYGNALVTLATAAATILYLSAKGIYVSNERYIGLER